MRSEEFDILLLEEKASIVLSEGRYIDERAIYNKSSIRLYGVYDFFVEVYSEIYENKIQQIVTTTEQEVLSNYVDLRDIYLGRIGITPPNE